MSIAEMIVARSKAAAALVAESKARIEAEDKVLQDKADEIVGLAYDMLIASPLKKAKINPVEATRSQENKLAHGLLYDAVVRQAQAIARDAEAAAYVINCLKHTWDGRVSDFVQTATCFVTVDEAAKMGYRWKA